MQDNHHEVEDTMLLNELKYDIMRFKKFRETLSEVGALKAEYQKSRFDALKDEGFTSRQALDIVKVEKTPFEFK